MTERLLDPVALADRLGEMTDEGLREVEVVFRLAADGCQIRLGDLPWLNIGGAVADRDHFVQFNNDTRVIPWLIAHAIRKHLAVGASLLDLVVYRMVQNDPPDLVDFQSHYERGTPPTPGKPFHAYQWLGVSVFLDRSRAERLANSARKRGEPAWVAQLTLTPDAGLWGVYKARTTHLEVFGLPQDLADRVVFEIVSTQSWNVLGTFDDEAVAREAVRVSVAERGAGLGDLVV
jgi:hypothetical protein